MGSLGSHPGTPPRLTPWNPRLTPRFSPLDASPGAVSDRQRYGAKCGRTRNAYQSIRRDAAVNWVTSGPDSRNAAAAAEAQALAVASLRLLPQPRYWKLGVRMERYTYCPFQLVLSQCFLVPSSPAKRNFVVADKLCDHIPAYDIDPFVNTGPRSFKTYVRRNYRLPPTVLRASLRPRTGRSPGTPATRLSPVVAPNGTGLSVCLVALKTPCFPEWRRYVRILR